jgi:alpha-tubulin suppressor-like RCC1 family protein
VAAGSWFSALLHEDGRIVVWGNNNSGIAGNGTTSDKISKTTIRLT